MSMTILIEDHDSRISVKSSQISELYDHGGYEVHREIDMTPQESREKAIAEGRSRLGGDSKRRIAGPCLVGVGASGCRISRSYLC